MMTKWRVIKKAVEGQFNYVGIEFNLEDGSMTGVKIKDIETSVRKRKTSQFEILENNKWMTLSYKEAPSLMRDFNKVRVVNGMKLVNEQQILKMLYTINNL